MKRVREAFFEWSLMLSLVVSLYAAYGFIEFKGHVLSIPLVPICAVLTIAIIADNFLVSRRCSVNIYVLVNVAFSIAAAFVAQKQAVLVPESLISRVLIASIAAMICFGCAFSATKEVQNNILIMNFDIIIIIQAIFIFLVGSGDHPLSVALMNLGFAACFASLGSLLIARMGGSDNSGFSVRSLLGILVIGALPLSIILLSVFSSDSLRTASNGIVAFVAMVARAIYRLLSSFFGTIARWLEALFGWNIYYDFDTPAYSQRVASNVVREYGDLTWVLFLPVVIILVGAIVFVVRMRGRRIGSRGRGKNRRKVQRSRLEKGRLLRDGGLLEKIRFLLAYLRNHDSLGARYIRLERKLKREGFRRRQSETPYSFLRRVATTIEETKKNDAEQMFFLANKIEQMFFSGKLYQQDKLCNKN